MTVRETWWLAPDAADALPPHALESVPACMHVQGKLLSSDRQSAAVLVAGPVPLLVKWRRPRPGRRLRTFFRASRERREATAALAADALGIPAPHPVAVAERRRGPELLGSVLVRPYLEGVVRADRWLDEGGSEALLARHLAWWHDLGFRHGDCYPKNVLVDGDRQTLIPIGAPGATVVRRGPRLDRRRRKDLAQWMAGLTALRSEAEAFDFLPAYARAARIGNAGALEASVRPLFAKIQAKKALRRATQPSREPEGAPLPTPLALHEEPACLVVRPMRDLERSRRGRKRAGQ